jgi:hypothetical protein
MHVLSTKHLRILVPLGVVLALVVLVLVSLQAGLRSRPSAGQPIPAPPRSAPATVASPAPRFVPPPPGPAPRPATSSVAPPREEPVEYRLDEESERPARRLLGQLLDDPYIRMDPDQRSHFLGAVLHAQREFEAEMERIFDQDSGRGGDDYDRRYQIMAEAEDAAAAQIGERLAEELATFLSPQQMTQLRGRIGFRDFVKAFWRTDVIAEVN